MRTALSTAVLAAASASATTTTTTAADAQDPACPPLQLVWSRATTEPPGGISPTTDAAGFEAAAGRVWSKGYGAAGHSIFTNVTALVPGATGYPVHYPANWGGCASENKGIEDLLKHLSTTAAKCPNTRFALGGHSQGGVVTVRTIPKIPADVQAKIVAIAMVGSPQCPQSVKAKCRSFCNTGDGICTGDGGAAAKGKCNDASGSGSGNSKAKGGLGRRSQNFLDLSGAAGFSIEDAAEDLLAVEAGGDAESMSETQSESQTQTLMETETETETESQASLLFKREVLRRAAPQCANFPDKEQGHAAKGASGKASHMAYNSDGYYVRAAACFVAKQFAAAGAGAAAATKEGGAAAAGKTGAAAAPAPGPAPAPAPMAS